MYQAPGKLRIPVSIHQGTAFNATCQHGTLILNDAIA